MLEKAQGHSGFHAALSQLIKKDKNPIFKQNPFKRKQGYVTSSDSEDAEEQNAANQDNEKDLDDIEDPELRQIKQEIAKL